MTSALACIHHWDVDVAAGHTSRARCLKCGEISEFLNAIPEDGDYHFQVAHSKPRREALVKEKPLHGGNNAGRARALAPARRKAEELYRQGKLPREVAGILRPQFGDIAISTLAGWKTRMAPASHEIIPEPAQSHTEIIPLWDTVMSLRPDLAVANRDRILAWKKLFDAAFEYLTTW